MKRKSIWEASSIRTTAYPTLEGKHQAEIVIIGGGITGLTAAMQLQEKGKSVALVEARKIGEGTTGLSSCHLTTDIDEEYRHIAENFDLNTASVVAESRKSAIDFIEKTASEKNIHCDFKRLPGYLYTEIPEDITMIKQEFSYASKAGLDVKLLDSAPLPFKTKKAILFKNQAEFNSSGYLNGLSEFLKDKIQLFESSLVTNIEKAGKFYLVETSSGVIKTSQVIMATHLPLFFNLLQTLSAPYISYMLAAKLNTKEYAEGLYWDTAEPYHYIRYYSVKGENFVIVGGEDHKTGHEKNTEKRFAQLEKYVRDHFDVSTIEYKWSAQYYEPADGLPYIGKSPFAENIYVATGFSGDGLVYGTIAGIILGDLLSGQENEWQKVFNSTRFTPTISAADFIKENIDVAKRFVVDRIKAEDEDISEIKAGEGKIVRMDGEAVAVSKNKDDQLSAVSAVCPHMKCLVNWNTFDETWDCPCHGSRFNAQGEVLYGPASKGLEAKNIQEPKITDKNHTDKR